MVGSEAGGIILAGLNQAPSLRCPEHWARGSPVSADALDINEATMAKDKGALATVMRGVKVILHPPPLGISKPCLLLFAGVT